MYHTYNSSDDFNDWLLYYGNQALQTGFGMEGYRGTPYQRGAGLGSFFKALFRMAVPVMKSAGKQVGKHALSAGANIMADLAKGEPVLESMKKHSRFEASKLLNEAGQALQGGEGLGKFRTSINTNNLIRKARPKSINTKKIDIFAQLDTKNVSNRRKIYSKH